MAKATVQPGQTLLDVAVQHLGDQTGVFDLAALNRLSITSDIDPGTDLELPDVINKRVVKVLQEGGHVPATNYSGNQSGIGYDDIQGDFTIG